MRRRPRFEGPSQAGLAHFWATTCALLAFGFPLGPAAAQSSDQPAGRQTIAVIEFHVRQGGRDYTSNLGRQLSDRAVAKLVARNRFDVVERTRLDKVLAELKIATGGLVDDRTAAEIGKLSGAKYLVSGTIDSAQETVRKKSRTVSIKASIRVIATETGRVVLAQSYSGSGTEVGKALDEIAGPFSRELVPDTRPGSLIDLDLDSGTGKISLGRNHGVDRETLVEVVRLGKEVIDPGTGERLGHEQQQLCVGRVIAAEDRFATIALGRLTKRGLLDFGGSGGRFKWQKLPKKDLQALTLDSKCIVRVVPEASR